MLWLCGYYSLTGCLPFEPGKAYTVPSVHAFVSLASKAFNLPVTQLKTPQAQWLHYIFAKVKYSTYFLCYAHY